MPSTTPVPKSIFSLGNVILLIVVVVGGIYAVFPGNRTLLERLIESGEYEDAIERIQEIDAITFSKDPAYYRNTEIRLRRLIALEEKDINAWEPLFKDAWEYYIGLHAPETLQGELLNIIPLLPTSSEAASYVQQNHQHLSLKDWKPIAEKLSQHALALSEPHIAALLYRQTIAEEDTTYANLIALLKIRAYADQPQEALEDIETLRPRIRLSQEEKNTLALKEINLLQATNQVSKAFDIAYAQWEAEPSRIQDDAFYAMIETLSIQSDRQRDALPLMRQRLAATPEDQQLFQRYLALTLATGQIDQSRDALIKRIQQGLASTEDRRQLAQIYEWQSLPDKAFDLYMELARQGDRDALDRMIALNAGLFRHYDLAETLQTSFPKENVTHYRTYYARLLTQIGDYENAVKQYQQLVEASEQPSAKIYAEMADAAMTMYDFEQAILAYRKAIAINPDDPLNIRRKKDIAWLLSLNGQYEESLAEYQAIFREHREEDMLPAIISLASILGKEQLYYDTLETIISLNDTQEPTDANSKFHRMEDHGIEQTWQTTMDQYRRTLAQLYADQKRYKEALNVLQSHSQLLKNASLLELYLYLLASNQQFAQAVHVLESEDIPTALLEDPRILRVSIWLYESVGKPQRALIYAEHMHHKAPEDQELLFTYARLLAYNGSPKRARALIEEQLQNASGADFYRLAADIALMSENYKDAEAYLTLYINTLDHPTSEDLALLADTRLARGDARGARVAYNLALKSHLRNQPELWN